MPGLEIAQIFINHTANAATKFWHFLHGRIGSPRFIHFSVEQNQRLFMDFPGQKLQFSSTFFWAFSYIKPCLTFLFFKWKESLIFRYFKVFHVSQVFTCSLPDLLLLEVGSLVVFLLREYILKVHMPVIFLKSYSMYIFMEWPRYWTYLNDTCYYKS
jgi:hypothetical protein